VGAQPRTEFVVSMAHSLKFLKNSDHINYAIGAMNKMHGHAAKHFANHPNHLKAVEKLRLPTTGPIPFVPPKDWNPKDPRKENGGYVDKYGYCGAGTRAARGGPSGMSS
jgi:hypothetical protein